MRITSKLPMAVLFLVACADSPFDTLYDDDFRFKSPMLSYSDLTSVIPMGNMNPPSHTVPTDHMYFYHSTTSPRAGVPVLAPADGLVTKTFSADYGESKVWVHCAAGFEYYVDHVVLDSGIRPGTAFKSGARIGQTSGYAYGVDLGLVNAKRTVTGLVQPDRYPSETQHADSPLAYFEQSVFDQLAAYSVRVGADKLGRFDQDQLGRLVGNWFQDGVPVSEDATKGGTAGYKHLAIAYSVRNPAQLIVSIGGGLTNTGLYLPQAGFIDPTLVTPGTGMISYQLYRNIGSTVDTPSGVQSGLLLLQMADAETLRAEFIPGAVSSGNFSANAMIYRR